MRLALLFGCFRKKREIGYMQEFQNRCIQIMTKPAKHWHKTRKPTHLMASDRLKTMHSAWPCIVYRDVHLGMRQLEYLVIRFCNVQREWMPYLLSSDTERVVLKRYALGSPFLSQIVVQNSINTVYKPLYISGG